MTRPELRKLNSIIKIAERLGNLMDDSVARAQLYEGTRVLISLYNSAKCDKLNAAASATTFRCAAIRRRR
jgi:hypothetical protein